MSKGPLKYYPRYPRDFLDGTIGMPLELKGAYSVLIDLIMLMGKRGLPDDPHYISGQLGCSVRKWNAIRKDLISRGKIEVKNEIISNKRADKEKIIQSKYQDKQAENASGDNKNNDLGQPPPTYINTESESYIGGGDTAQARDHTFREKIILAMGYERSALTATGKIICNSAEMQAAQKWLDDLGLSEAEVLTVIGEVVAQKRDGPPTALKYFDGPMQRLAAQKSAPAMAPTSNVTAMSKARLSSAAGGRDWKFDMDDFKEFEQ